MVHAAIIGTGDLAYGLSHLFSINNSGTSGNALEVSKPNLKKEGAFHDTKVPLTDFDDALLRADVLILAIPGYAMADFVSKNLKKLSGKILVDVSNGGEKKFELGDSSIELVKGFNDVGAVDILLKKTGK